MPFVNAEDGSRVNSEHVASVALSTQRHRPVEGEEDASSHDVVLVAALSNGASVVLDRFTDPHEAADALAAFE